MVFQAYDHMVTSLVVKRTVGTLLFKMRWIYIYIYISNFSDKNAVNQPFEYMRKRPLIDWQIGNQ